MKQVNPFPRQNHVYPGTNCIFTLSVLDSVHTKSFKAYTERVSTKNWLFGASRIERLKVVKQSSMKGGKAGREAAGRLAAGSGSLASLLYS